MAFMAVLESDLRALSAEARRRYPAVKDGAEHGILKVKGSFSLFLFEFRVMNAFFVCSFSVSVVLVLIELSVNCCLYLNV